MRNWVRVALLTLVSTGVAGVQGCSSGCDDEQFERASAFLNTHQSCQTNDDCVVVSDYCGKIPGGFCGQLPLSRQAAESPEWQSIERDLAECSDGETCAVCGAALVPTCTAGSCRGG